jgi:autotransporter-associated beta strand protein
LTLGGANAYTGATAVSAGILRFAKRASLYNDNAASWTPINIGVESGATLAVDMQNQTAGLVRSFGLSVETGATGPAPSIVSSGAVEILEEPPADGKLQIIDAQFAEKAHVPVVVNGRIARHGETDKYVLHVKPGMTLNLAVESYGLHSPLDPQIVVLSHPEAGTPQGGVISPLLANIYLHEVLDEWFVRDVQPRLSGRAVLVRYADDFVFVFARRDDAERVLDVLPKRFGKYGLTLHPDKTRLVPFHRPDRDDGDDDGPGTFDLLGFTHHWALSRKGKWVVKKRTAKDRFSRTLRRIAEWCRKHRHDAVETQQRALARKLSGHYAYFGVTSNYAALAQLHHEVKAIWRKWLSRRSQRGFLNWNAMHRLLERFPLPLPRIVHRYGT